MKCANVVNALIVAFSCNIYTNGQITFLDKLTPQYRLLRGALFNFIGRSDDENSYNWNLKRGKVQKPFPKSHQFFCDPNGPGKRSQYIPHSVNQLRPGDIDVIGAMGDSLTAGNGALATNVLQLVVENKGVSWSIGGQSTWHKYLTLPNIIKVFNPNLYGYSISDGLSTEKTSRFNTADPGAMSRDIPHQAEIMVKRMSSDRNVNINEHWKLITILIGPNDVCSHLCYITNPENSIDDHEKNLVTALRTLRDNLPRTMVNLVTHPNLKLITNIRGEASECKPLHIIECSCVFGLAFRKKRDYYFDIMERWKEALSKVAHMEEFDREDFTVNIQPFMEYASIPTLPNGDHDLTYMSLDCFHFSQKGNAITTNAIWNNMMEPEGQKSTNWKTEFEEIKCPTVKRPYIATKRNS